MLLPGLSRWQGLAIAAAAGALLFTGTWLHGRQAGVESERQKLLAAHAASLETIVKRQVEIAQLMGTAVRMSHEREREAVGRRDAAERRARSLRERRAEQAAGDAACAAWAAAPVGCRVRAEGAADR